MKKLSQEQIEELIFLKNKEIPSKEILTKFSIAMNTLRWHTEPDFRIQIREYQRKKYKQLTNEQKKKIQDSRKEYQRNYHNNRFKTDLEFKRKQLESNKKWRRNE